jgi:hypothetical protein
MDIGKFEYIKSRRKKLLYLLSAIAVFGIVLFFSSRHSGIRKTDDAATILQDSVEEGGVSGLYRKIVADEIEAMETVSRNILADPVFVSYRKKDSVLTVVSRINLRGSALDSPVFYLKKHGTMYFSEKFTSGDGNTHCKGVMEEGSDRFFVYYCSRNN